MLLSLVFTSMSSHCFIPENFMKSVIIPLVKDKTGDITDKNNYRPIALSTMMSKIIEKIFMDRYESLFRTTDNQFGFKKNYSTDRRMFPRIVARILPRSSSRSLAFRVAGSLCECICLCLFVLLLTCFHTIPRYK